MQKRAIFVGVLMTLAFGLFQAAWIGAAQTGEAAGKLLISDVIILGNQRMSTEQIKAQLRTQVGKKYNAANIEDDVRDLYKTHQFSNIASFLEEDGSGQAKIYFSFRDMPNLVQKVTFLGAKHIKEEELINITGLQAGMALNPCLNVDCCRKIQQEYEEMGRSFTSCQLIEGGNPGDTEVIFQITEGPKVQVCNIRFSGNTFVDDAKLMKIIPGSKIGGGYNRQMAESEVEQLVQFYRSFGYKNVKVALEVQPSVDDSEVTLIFRIEEGERYRSQDGTAKRSDSKSR